MWLMRWSDRIWRVDSKTRSLLPGVSARGCWSQSPRGAASRHALPRLHAGAHQEKIAIFFIPKKVWNRPTKVWKITVFQGKSYFIPKNAFFIPVNAFYNFLGSLHTLGILFIPWVFCSYLEFLFHTLGIFFHTFGILSTSFSYLWVYFHTFNFSYFWDAISYQNYSIS